MVVFVLIPFKILLKLEVNVNKSALEKLSKTDTFDHLSRKKYCHIKGDLYEQMSEPTSLRDVRLSGKFVKTFYGISVPRSSGCVPDYVFWRNFSTL